MKNQENPNWCGEKKSTIANDMTQILELLDKNWKATITETLQEVRGVHTLETNGKTESLSKETGYIKSQKDILDLKNTITKIKILVIRLNSRMKERSERISKLKVEQ